MTILEALFFGYYDELALDDLIYISENSKFRFEINDGMIVGVTKYN